MKDILLKKIEDTKKELASQYLYAFSPKSKLLKANLKKYYSELDKFDRNLEKEQYGIALAKTLLKKHGVLAAQYSTTSVRGFNTLRRRGYEIQNHDVRNIALRGTFEAIFINNIVSDMILHGFVVDYSNTSGIVIKSYSKI